MVFGLQTQPKSWLTGYTFWVNHYLEIVFSKISVVNPPPPLIIKTSGIFLIIKIDIRQTMIISIIMCNVYTFLNAEKVET